MSRLTAARCLAARLGQVYGFQFEVGLHQPAHNRCGHRGAFARRCTQTP